MRSSSVFSPRESSIRRGQWSDTLSFSSGRHLWKSGVDVLVDRDSGEIRLLRAVMAADAGQVVNPDGLSNQIEGGFVQAASWTLYEQVTFDRSGITSRDWDSYPILRFTNAPVIETVILNRPNFPFVGAGEATQNPTPAAIANAVYDAVGIRLREIPFTPERVKAALAED